MTVFAITDDETMRIEILPPESARPAMMICDCCQEKRPANAFDLDSCGLCRECVECDTWIIPDNADW